MILQIYGVISMGRFHMANLPRTFNLNQEIQDLRQGSMSLSDMEDLVFMEGLCPSFTSSTSATSVVSARKKKIVHDPTTTKTKLQLKYCHTHRRLSPFHVGSFFSTSSRVNRSLEPPPSVKI